MLKKSALILSVCVLLSACASSQPNIIQASSGSSEITVKVGMATQIEMPDGARVTSAVVGDRALVTATADGDVVTLSASGGEGETNLIIRARDDGSKTKVFQYRITVQKP